MSRKKGEVFRSAGSCILKNSVSGFFVEFIGAMLSIMRFGYVLGNERLCEPDLPMVTIIDD